LRGVLDQYDDREWQHDHSRFGLRPEDHLWSAAQGLLDLDTAIRALACARARTTVPERACPFELPFKMDAMDVHGSDR
jgi:hypothetical protein